MLAQWPGTTSDSGPDGTYAVRADGSPSPVRVYLHWSAERVAISVQGWESRQSGGAFIHAGPLAEHAGFPVTHVTPRGGHVYQFEEGGKLRIGLFFLGEPEEFNALSVFGQEIAVR